MEQQDRARVILKIIYLNAHGGGIERNGPGQERSQNDLYVTGKRASVSSNVLVSIVGGECANSLWYTHVV